MRPFLEEIASRHAFGLSMIRQLPNPDPVLKRSGKNITVYRDLLSDAHVGGCVRRRKSMVKSKKRHLFPGDSEKKVFDFVEKSLDQLDMDQIVSEALDGALFGYQPMEVDWQLIDGFYYPVGVYGKPAEWFCFDSDNQLRFKCQEAPLEGKLVPEGKFLLFRQDATYDNPYGIGDLSRCFWATQFKRGGLKFWVTFAERFGSPWLVGKHPRGTPVSETDQMLSRLEDMVQDAVAVIPDDSSIDIIEASGKSNSSDLYEKLLYFCRSEISIALLGQNQTTEATANLASAKAGLEVSYDIASADAKLVSAGINELIYWMVYYNFGDTAKPIYEIMEPEDMNLDRASRDKILYDAGVRFTKDYYRRHYGFDESDISL